MLITENFTEFILQPLFINSQTRLLQCYGIIATAVQVLTWKRLYPFNADQRTTMQVDIIQPLLFHRPYLVFVFYCHLTPCLLEVGLILVMHCKQLHATHYYRSGKSGFLQLEELYLIHVSIKLQQLSNQKINWV